MSTVKLLILLIFFAGSTKQAVCQKQGSFSMALSKHLKAISNKNLPDIAATVADSITLIFPDGELLQSKEKFVEMHRNWFKDSLWTMTTEVLNTTETRSLAYANVKYRYRKFKPDGKELSVSDTYLLLIFKKEKNTWKVIHDQNTKISL